MTTSCSMVGWSTWCWSPKSTYQAQLRQAKRVAGGQRGLVGARRLQHDHRLSIGRAQRGTSETAAGSDVAWLWKLCMNTKVTIAAAEKRCTEVVVL